MLDINNMLEVKWNKEEVKKNNLSFVEFKGLESILQELLDQQQEEQGIESFDISRYTIFRDNECDILDGYYDYIDINNHGITSLFLTNNNIIVAKCYPFDNNCNIDYEQQSYLLRIN